MNVSPVPMNRRAFLRGVGRPRGAAVPRVACSAGGSRRRARPSSAAAPPRHLHRHRRHGVESWRPRSRPARAAAVHPPSLDFPKDDLLVLSGLRIPAAAKTNSTAHEHCAYLHLTACRLAKEGRRPRRRLRRPARPALVGTGILSRRSKWAPTRRRASSSSPTRLSCQYEANPRLSSSGCSAAASRSPRTGRGVARPAGGAGDTASAAQLRPRVWSTWSWKMPTSAAQAGPRAIDAGSTNTSHAIRSVERRDRTHRGPPRWNCSTPEPRAVAVGRPANLPRRSLPYLADRRSHVTRPRTPRRVHPAHGRPDGAGLPDRHDARRHAGRRQRRGACSPAS